MQLNRQELQRRVEEEGLLRGYTDLERQLTPNGFDMSVAEVHRFEGPGQLDFTNEERQLPETTELATEDGWWDLDNTVYKLVMQETVDIPLDLVGIGFPRSSLMRMGAHIQNGFWEAGYEGKTECLLAVDNPEGMRLKEGARVLQISFHELDDVDEGYDGRYSV
jgi:dUTP pyrophosphatase